MRLGGNAWHLLHRIGKPDGDELRLEGLAAMFDGRIEELRSAFGEIGDMRLHVMAALTVADDLVETKRRLAALEEEMAARRTFGSAGEDRSQVLEGQLAETLVKTAERIERLAKSLNVSSAASQDA